MELTLTLTTTHTILNNTPFYESLFLFTFPSFFVLTPPLQNNVPTGDDMNINNRLLLLE